MHTSNIPFPQELTNIPFEQIFILTNPNVGITAKTIKLIEFIHSMAKRYGQKNHIVHEMPVDHPGLWDCFICKVKTELEVQLLIANKDTLVEMLCEFWGLNYSDVCKSIVIPGWHKNNRGVTIGGDRHPERLSLKPVETAGEQGKEGYRVTLQVIQDHTESSELLDIRKAFQNIFYHNLDISIEDITALYEDVKKSIKTYHLFIDVKRDDPTIDGRSPRIKSCDIFLIDNLGNRYQLKMKEKKGEKPLEPQILALYFTFILFKEGKRIMDISDEDFFGLFMKILTKLPYGGYKKTTPDQLIENVKPKLSKLRKAIWDATHDSYAREQFSIDGYEGEEYKVAGATDEDRKKIKTEFGLE